MTDGYVLEMSQLLSVCDQSSKLSLAVLGMKMWTYIVFNLQGFMTANFSDTKFQNQKCWSYYIMKGCTCMVKCLEFLQYRYKM